MRRPTLDNHRRQEATTSNRFPPPFIFRTDALIDIRHKETRHIQLAQFRRSQQWPRAQQPSGERSHRPRPHDHCLFVLGSGGHTKEMLMMMDDGSCDFVGFHRRYIISSGDRMSLHHLQDYEDRLGRLCREATTSPGSFDTRTVTRARRVHQPLWTTPWTSVLSLIDILSVLLSPPPNDARQPLRYPSRIYSNGPATGFFVALAIHVLKLFYVVPEASMLFIYIESWARISSLSLTGKLLMYTGIADAFYVQHDKVARKYGLVNAGEMVFNARRLDGA
ncbi:hypothetical protein HIM_07909 [Hirsutella minnesotensis 3608]|uniref:UDP-N-acetylglucosamine transferase subunit ALG14 n=1 Tax=Hirsutella minnesotensis 3608 TaxID=1043627 RepID=A0A0F7ZYM2_9HYPO|nr:hypothetical protein HIM_07909 [Hirsutella minnesotensis 3608]